MFIYFMYASLSLLFGINGKTTMLLDDFTQIR